MKRLQNFSRCAGRGLTLAGVLLCALPAAQAQVAAPGAPGQTFAAVDKAPGSKLEKPSQPPAFSIAVAPLGFSPPGPIYLGQQNSLASLDFLDENRLLFTFRVPGLIRREAEDTASSAERQLRAVVLTLPEGTVQAEALWTVHDRVRYLWMLKDGHFLFRDRDSLQLGDATLELKPFLRFPGPLLWIGMDPQQQLLATESVEPAAKKPAGQTEQDQTDLVVRILHRDTGRVMLVSRVRASVHLPINSDGYLESLHGDGEKWVVNLKSFSGGSTVLGRVDSVCSPAFEFVSQSEALVTACSSAGGRKLTAMTTGGLRLWDLQIPGAAIWPLLVMAPDGSRLARETLVVDHSVNAPFSLGAEDVKQQRIQVFDAANGKLALATPASPVLDAGGNLAISPSGRRVAVLNDGAIQIFELPAAPALADGAGYQPVR